jgi:hypothetical protein
VKGTDSYYSVRDSVVDIVWGSRSLDSGIKGFGGTSIFLTSFRVKVDDLGVGIHLNEEK